MPFLQNAEKKICQVYDNELKPLLEKGWKELTAKEEAIYREGLVADHSLTSSVAIEAARVKAGIYKALGQAGSAVQTAEKTVSKATSQTPKTQTSSKTSSTKATGKK